MESGFFQQGITAKIVHLALPDLNEPFPTLPSYIRVYTLAATIAIPLAVILTRRVLSGIPFAPPPDARSFTVFNKKDFICVHGAEALPKKTPVEPLEGQRWLWALGQLMCAIALGTVDVVVLVQRAIGGDAVVEEALELALWAAVAGLFALRFYPTPYRPLLVKAGVITALVPMALCVERDLRGLLLYHVPGMGPGQARTGWGVYARIGLMVGIQCAALLTPRQWYPVDPYSGEKSSPEQTASTWSYIGSYDWIQNIIVVGWKHDIEEKHLPELPDYDRSRLWYSKYVQNRKSSAVKTIMHLFQLDFLAMTCCSILVGILQFITPLSMKGLLSYVEGSTVPVMTPWVYVVALAGGPVLVAIAYQAYIFNATRLIIRVKGAFTQALLQKTLLLRLQDEENVADAKTEKDAAGAPKKSRVGMINNLMSSDLMTLTDAREIFMLLGTVPIEIVLALFFLYDMLGWSSLIGVALMVLTMFIPILLAKTLAKIQKRLRAATDARVGLMSETLNSIRAVKYFGLEEPFLGRVRESRAKELRLMAVTAVFNLSFHIISTLLPIINMIVTFGLYTIVMKKPLTPSIAFTSISLFDILRGQFRWLSFVAQLVLNAWVSFERVDKFLHGEEELDAPSAKSTAPGQFYSPPSFTNATLSWCAPGTDGDNNFRMQNLNVQCIEGGLNVIAGPVGSGKSSFLLGLLGEMRLLKGEVNLYRQSGISYCSQTPWLQCDTVRNNILFGTKLDEKRYQQVVEACGLNIDFEKLEDGDQTEVGEKGVTLSGGQKQRVALARAVYSPAQTVLLDDVLSALDAATGKHVFEKCLKGEILAGRTVVLVTHHLSLVSSAAKKIVVFNDGQVVSDGPPSSLSDDLLELIEEAPAAEDSAATEIVPKDIIDSPPTDEPRETAIKINGKSAGKLVQEETYAKGSVSRKLLWKYLMYLGSPLVLVFLISLNVMDNFGGLLNQFYVGLWSDEYTKHPDTIDVKFWLAMYAAVLFGTTVFNTAVYGVWYCFVWLAAKRLHDKLVTSVIYSPIRFFDTTPIGRVINRLSNDVRAVDGKIGPYMLQVLNQALEVIFRVFVMSGLIPAFLAPTSIACVVGVVAGLVYSRAQIGVKRIMSVKESPLMSHFGDTIAGILTIRAFSCQDRFLEENLKRTDDFNRPSETYYNLNRWIGIRISWCTALVGGAAGVIAVTSKGYSAGLIGFSMTNALAFSGSVLYGVRYLNALEMELNSFERIEEWVQLPREDTPTDSKQPPAAWPTQGDVQIRELSVKYSKDTPEVLNKISFDVKSGERVGIVGRTGAGKSSLALSILGFTEISHGSITINGLDITNVNSEALRRRVTIIPQDPVLFSGTIRTNLDPFSEIDDTELQAALEGCGLAGVAEDPASANSSGTSTPTGTKRITLDTPVTSGGDNLSQGQRQLLAFGRAIVRNSKLLILDEATSSTDMKTDERIRKTLQTNPSFLGSSLILIAHRLRTVMTFDRILVLENKGNGGEVVEFDTPETLLNDKNGVLYSLAKKSGEFDELYAMATGKDD